LTNRSEKWPALLGLNELQLKPSAQLSAKVGQYP
jgi:uncharacterized membrane protein